MFGLMFGVAAAVVLTGFLVVIGLISYRAARSVRDPEYRARLQAQARIDRSRNATSSGSSDPTADPGNPASPMFPGGPGNPL